MNLDTAKRLLAQGHAEAAKDLLLDMDSGGQTTAEAQYLLGTIFHRENQLADQASGPQAQLHAVGPMRLTSHASV